MFEFRFLYSLCKYSERRASFMWTLIKTCSSCLTYDFKLDIQENFTIMKRRLILNRDVLQFSACLALVAFTFGKVEPDLSLSRYVSPSEKIKLKQVFEDAWKFDDLGLLHYAIASYRVLNVESPLPVKVWFFYIKETSSFWWDNW